MEQITEVPTNELMDAIMFIGYIAICGLILLAWFFAIEYGITIFGLNKDEEEK